MKEIDLANKIVKRTLLKNLLLSKDLLDLHIQLLNGLITFDAYKIMCKYTREAVKEEE